MITVRVERILENYVIYLINSIETYVYSFNFPSFHFYQPVSASDHVMVPSKMFQQNAQAKWVVVFGEAVNQIWNEWAKCVCNWFCYSDRLGLHSLLLLPGASLFKDWNVRAGNGEDHHRARGSGSESDMDDSDNNDQPQHGAICKLHSPEMGEPLPGKKFVLWTYIKILCCGWSFSIMFWTHIFTASKYQYRQVIFKPVTFLDGFVLVPPKVYCF